MRLVPCWNNPVGGEENETKSSSAPIFLLLKYNRLGNEGRGKLGCFEELNLSWSLLQAAIFTWIQRLILQIIPCFDAPQLNNVQMDDSTEQTFRRGVLMVFAEKLRGD